ncbi:hypothetical protein CSKR_100010 [Clonorchis sinensis]|uniref:Uncharacterized protein n=1 Tax=Clonorchis sinensis TaxID=79923 RepID=A0A419QCG8_CLOSI|nr:hypothetical protein CSKR_100010 [Clonorchis sinensis]
MFAMSHVPKFTLVYVIVKSSGPFPPSTKKAFSESPPTEIWTHFLSYKGRCQYSDQCFALSASTWRGPALALQDFRKEAERMVPSSSRREFAHLSVASCVLKQRFVPPVDLFSYALWTDFRFTAVPHFTKCQLIFCFSSGCFFEKYLGPRFQKTPSPFGWLSVC